MENYKHGQNQGNQNQKKDAEGRFTSDQNPGQRASNRDDASSRTGSNSGQFKSGDARTEEAARKGGENSHGGRKSQDQDEY